MYRKFTARHLFNGHGLLPEGQVLITSQTGVIEDLVPLADAGDGIQLLEGILCPGLINAHCHLELSHMQGRIPEHTGLVDFVLKIIQERHFTEVEIGAAIIAGEDEMLRNGIVAVGDICNTPFTIAQKQLKRLQYHNFIEVSGVPPAVAQTRFDRALELLQQFAAISPSSVVPHAPYSVSEDLFALINGRANNTLLSIHNQETAAENELFQDGSGDFLRLFKTLQIDATGFQPAANSSIQTYLPWLTNPRALMLVHNVHTSAADMQFVQSIHQPDHPSIFWCLCPNANQYISNSLPPVDLLLQHPCSIVLGTDSLASNHQLSILEEMKTLQKAFPDLATETLLQWATINGAKALQMQDSLGSFEKGKQPGIVLIETQDTQTLAKATRSTRIL